MLALTLSLPSVPRRSTRPARGQAIQDSLESRASRGDRHALESLLREHARAIHDVARHLVGDSYAHDAAQEALEKIVVSIASFDPERGSFRTWALTITRNICRDRLRRRGLERKTFVDDGDDVTSLTASDAPDVERIALARIESERLLAAIETLPEPMRIALILFHVHDSSYEEIAGALDVPIGTVMTWLHRGRKRLRMELDERTAPIQGGTAR